MVSGRMLTARPRTGKVTLLSESLQRQRLLPGATSGSAIESFATVSTLVPRNPKGREGQIIDPLDWRNADHGSVRFHKGKARIDDAMPVTWRVRPVCTPGAKEVCEVDAWIERIVVNQKLVGKRPDIRDIVSFEVTKAGTRTCWPPAGRSPPPGR